MAKRHARLGENLTDEERRTEIKRTQSKNEIYMKLMAAANKRTALADVRYDDSGNRIDPNAEEDDLDSDSSVVIVKK
ncbi:MAG: hypothetical protein J6X44_09405 [Thermoguttaceae bacterium]|nr:hypothetical protein [Thermoguttaceae bacterium]